MRNFRGPVIVISATWATKEPNAVRARKAEALAGLGRFAPAGCIGQLLQDRVHARMLFRKLQPEVHRIPTRRMRELVEKTLIRKTRVRLADGSPPQR